MIPVMQSLDVIDRFSLVSLEVMGNDSCHAVPGRDRPF